MTTYEIKSGVKKRLLIKNVFSQTTPDTFKYRKDIYDNSVSVELVVWYEDNDSPCMSTRFIDNGTGCTFPIFCEYGKSDVRKIAYKNYKEIMKRFAKKGIVDKVEKKK